MEKLIAFKLTAEQHEFVRHAAFNNRVSNSEFIRSLITQKMKNPSEHKAQTGV